MEYFDDNTQDIELKGQEIIYFISKHYKISPVEVEQMNIEQISRWYTWAVIVEEKQREHIEKEQRKRRKNTSQSTVSLPYDKVTDLW